MPETVRLWKRQTYRNSELLILADGEDVRGAVPDEPGVRYVYSGVYRTIGDKRNLANEQARGEIICHWDDDDYSAPFRLERQLERLQGFDVTGYNAMAFTDGERWWKYAGGMGYALGTSLCYRKGFWERWKFPTVQVGEDAVFSARASAAKTLCSVDAHDEMYATIHPSNTSPRHLSATQWRPLAEDQFRLFYTA